MIHVIIVDDELLAGVGIQSLIDGKEGIHVAGVFGGPEEAIPFLQKNEVDIVITDIEMSEMNGLDFIRIIRGSNLAGGVIILSCHDDFSYAQEAIAKGTDSYLLKHKIDADSLIGEVKAVYDKTRAAGVRPVRETLSAAPSPETLTGDEVFAVCILRMSDPDGNYEAEGRIEGTMLVHLIEGIVSRYRLGTMFFPYDREPFILFQTDRGQDAAAREEAIRAGLETIRSNLRHYYSGVVTAGLSTDFTELAEMQAKFAEAETAVGLRYYHPDRAVFRYRAPGSKFRSSEFSAARFLAEQGMETFAAELNHYLAQASFCCVRPRDMTARLSQLLGRLVFWVLDHNPFEQAFRERALPDAELSAAILGSRDVDGLRESVLRVIGAFREACRAELHRDELSEALAYIDGHLAEKLTLGELADLCCMSVPSFTKKFKERTGRTVVQYVSDRRVERAKQLLLDKGRTLEQIAEESGFSNANYLIRVFKKVTGQTISDYRG